MHSPELIWDGEPDLGSRIHALASDFRSCQHPAGVSISQSGSHSLVEIPTRSLWSFATWGVSAIMVWFGLAAENWFLLALSPFMVGAALMQTFGRLRIVVRDGRVDMLEGVGGLGRRIRIDLRTIERVEYAVKRGRGGATTWIVVKDAGRELKFGRYLNDEQTRFVIAFLLDAAGSVTA